MVSKEEIPKEVREQAEKEIKGPDEFGIKRRKALKEAGDPALLYYKNQDSGDSD